MKRLFACILAVCMLLPLAACAADDGSSADTNAPASTTAPTETTPAPETAPTHDENGYLLDDIPDDLDFGGETVSFLYWTDATMPEFFAEKLTGEIVNDAIYHRNEIVTDRLGVQFEFTGTKGNSSNRDAYVNMARKAVEAGDGTYDIFASYSWCAAMMAMQGLIQDLNDFEIINFDKPWWPEKLTDEFTINDRLFFASGDISSNLLYMMIATYVNRQMITDYGLTDPYEHVKNGTWTLEKMFEYCNGVYSDINNNEKKDDADRYGAVVYDVCVDAFFTGCDLISISRDSAGELRIDPDFAGDKTHDFIVKMANAFNHTNDWYTVNSTKIRNIFAEGRSLFITDRAFIAETVLRSTDISYGILPQPKYDERQESYVTCMGHPYTMYSIAFDSKHPDAAAAVIECLASESYRRITPAVFEQSMKLKYAQDDVTSQMYDIIRSGVSFDLGRVFSSVFDNKPIHLYKKSITGDNTNWASTFAADKDFLEAKLAEIVKTLSEIGT